MPKVTFYPETKLIVVNYGVTTLDVKADLYSEAKRQWLTNPELNKLRFPFRTVGGDPLGGNLSAGSYFFFQNQLGWRIRPYEGDHTLTIVGNLFPEDPDQPMFIPTLGNYTVVINLMTSSLTQTVFTQGLAPEDKQAIADLVEQQTGQPLKQDLAVVKKHDTLHRIIVGDYILYEENGQIIFKYRMVKDEDGNVIELIPESP
jgi:hypothetical protein